MNLAGRISLSRAVAAMVGVVVSAWGLAWGQGKSPPAGAAEGPAAPVVIYTKDNAPPTPKLEDLPLKESVSRSGITWTFEKPVRAGQFVNGDWYVVGPATVAAIDPAPVIDGEVRNGSMLNPPARLQTSAFDSRIPKASWFHKEMVAKLPISMKPGDALMSSISLAKPGSGGRPVKSFSVLTCLKEPVPADAFRPSYCDRKQIIYLARDLRRDILPRLPFPPPPAPEADEPSRAKNYKLDMKYLEGIFEKPWHHLSFLEDAEAEYQFGGYGRSICQWVSNATLMLCMDLKPEEKERLLINLVGHGLDLWGIVQNEGFWGWPTLGGWGSGRKWPMVFAGVMLGDEKMASPTKTYPRLSFQEDNQTHYDDCWTGAGVLYAGHSGWVYRDGARRQLGWGPYEHVHPSRWVSWLGTSYRSNMTSSTWIGQALAIRILRAEKEWNGDAFLDYCDRWMFEPDPGYGNGGRTTTQGFGWDPFAEQMWRTYRQKLPDIPGRDKSPQPIDGWKKKRELKGPAVEIGKGGGLRVKGQPMLPIMIFGELPGRIDDALAIGANVLAEGCFEKPQSYWAYWGANVNNREFLDQLEAKGLYGVFGADGRTIGHPALLGWIHVEEPDVIAEKAPAFTDRQLQQVYPSYRVVKAGKSYNPPPDLKNVPDNLLLVQPPYEWMKKMDASRPGFLTVGESFLKAAAEGKKDLCEAYLKNCDAVGCAVYPLTGMNSPAALAEVAQAVSKLVELAPGKCVYAWIETCQSPAPAAAAPARATTRATTQPASQPMPPPAVKPELVRAQVWMAIIRGASAIGYRGFEGMDMKAKPDAEMLAELKKINAKLTALAPAILAAPAKAKVEMSIAGNLACHLKATELDGSLYVFAQNIDLGAEREKAAAGRPARDIAPRAGKATIKVPGLKAGTRIEVVDENRTLTADEGQFTDEFAPLAEHVYKCRP